MARGAENTGLLERRNAARRDAPRTESHYLRGSRPYRPLDWRSVRQPVNGEAKERSSEGRWLALPAAVVRALGDDAVLRRPAEATHRDPPQLLARRRVQLVLLHDEQPCRHPCRRTAAFRPRRTADHRLCDGRARVHGAGPPRPAARTVRADRAGTHCAPRSRRFERCWLRLAPDSHRVRPPPRCGAGHVRERGTWLQSRLAPSSCSSRSRRSEPSASTSSQSRRPRTRRRAPKRTACCSAIRTMAAAASC